MMLFCAMKKDKISRKDFRMGVLLIEFPIFNCKNQFFKQLFRKIHCTQRINIIVDQNTIALFIITNFLNH